MPNARENVKSAGKHLFSVTISFLVALPAFVGLSLMGLAFVITITTGLLTSLMNSFGTWLFSLSVRMYSTRLRKWLIAGEN
jgi:hypothetical protein